MTVGNEISYYLRPVNGDDSNDGQSFATAWKTWQKVIDEMCVSGVTANNAALFLVNEGGAYTGPWHTGTGDTISVPALFTSDTKFHICGLSADGSYDEKTKFEFDLSGFTGSNWLNASSGLAINMSVMFKNITWKNGDLYSIINNLYSRWLGASSFVNCIFEDNECSGALILNDAYFTIPLFDKCIFRRNNVYNSSYGLLNSRVSTSRSCGSNIKNCIFESNQTDSSSSKYIIASTPALGDLTISVENSVFYNNGYDTDDVCVYLRPQYDNTGIDARNNIFFNNAGTGLMITDTTISDAVYGNTNTINRVRDNIFAYNNKSMDIGSERGIRQSSFTNNVFYNNTVEDIPDLIETLLGSSGGNFVFDPEFNNGYSGDFSVPHDSRLFSYSMVDGVPIGGSHVQRRLFTTTTSGSLSLGTADVGDTVTVSGKSYQKVNQNPPVWRRYITQPPLTGTFSPSSLSSLYGWYDASTDVAVSGTDVTSWTDKSGNGNDLNATVSPTLVSSAQNGLDVIRFSTGNEDLDAGSTADNLSSFNFYLVLKPDDAYYVTIGNLTGSFYILAGSSVSTSSVNGGVAGNISFSLDGGIFNPTNRLNVNSAIGSDSTYHIVGGFGFNISAWTGPWGIGKFDSASTYNYTGDWAEIIILDSTPSDADKRKIEGYLAHKWGLAGNLPANHPFKNYAP